MVAIPGKHRFENTHRLHGRINTLCVTLSAVAISAHYLWFGEARFPPGKGGDLYCRRIPAALRYPISGALEMALADQTPQSIDLEFIAETDTAQLEPGPEVPRRETDGLASIYLSIISPLFVQFYEGYNDWLYRKQKHPDNWPEIWRFGRIVRNTMAHGGKVDIAQKDSPASWRGLSYSSADNGREIVTREGDLSTGDIFTLMIEMSEELDAQGCLT